MFNLYSNLLYKRSQDFLDTCLIPGSLAKMKFDETLKLCSYGEFVFPLSFHYEYVLLWLGSLCWPQPRSVHALPCWAGHACRPTLPWPGPRYRQVGCQRANIRGQPDLCSKGQSLFKARKICLIKTLLLLLLFYRKSLVKHTLGNSVNFISLV